jgi:hypothetical protein
MAVSCQTVKFASELKDATKRAEPVASLLRNFREAVAEGVDD